MHFANPAYHQSLALRTALHEAANVHSVCTDYFAFHQKCAGGPEPNTRRSTKTRRSQRTQAKLPLRQEAGQCSL